MDSALVAGIAGTVHTVGFIAWVAGLFLMAYLLGQLKKAGTDDARLLVAKITKRGAMVADIGITLSLLAGLHMLFAYKLYTTAWMMLKLLLVVIVVIMHVYLRRETKKATKGELVAPGPMLPIVVLLVIAVVTLAKLKPFV